MKSWALSLSTVCLSVIFKLCITSMWSPLLLLPSVSPLVTPQHQCAPPTSHRHCGLQFKFKMEFRWPWVPLSLSPAQGGGLWPGEPGLGVSLLGTVTQ